MFCTKAKKFLAAKQWSLFGLRS